MPAFTFEETLTYQDWRGYERECLVEIDYTVDRNGDLTVTRAIAKSDDPEAHRTLDEHADDMAADHSIDAYPEWMAEYGEYLRDQRIDRALVA